MGDTAAFAPETVNLFEFKWLKPGSGVVTPLILLDTGMFQLVVSLARERGSLSFFSVPVLHLEYCCSKAPCTHGCHICELPNGILQRN